MKTLTQILGPIVAPRRLLSSRWQRLLGGALVVLVGAVLLLRAFGIGFAQMAAWLPAVVDHERGAPVSASSTAASVPAAVNVVPPAEGDPDAASAPNAPDTANGDPPPAGDVIPPDEP